MALSPSSLVGIVNDVSSTPLTVTYKSYPSTPQEVVYQSSTQSSTNTGCTSLVNYVNTSNTFSNVVNGVINAIINFVCGVASFVSNNSDVFIAVAGASSVTRAVIRFSDKVPLASSLRTFLRI